MARLRTQSVPGHPVVPIPPSSLPKPAKQDRRGAVEKPPLVTQSSYLTFPAIHPRRVCSPESAEDLLERSFQEKG